MILSFKPQFVPKILDGTKIHTIREDPHDRWKIGNIIHFATGIRTKHYKCFKIGECTEIQQVVMHLDPYEFDIFIDGHKRNDINSKLVKNDGFDHDYIAFWNWFFGQDKTSFSKEYVGKIIHWTNFKY